MMIFDWGSFFAVGTMIALVVAFCVVIPRRTKAPLFGHNLTTTIGVLLSAAIVLIALLGVLYLMKRPGGGDYVQAARFAAFSWAPFGVACWSLVPATRYQEMLAHPPDPSMNVILRIFLVYAILFEVMVVFFFLIW